MTNFLRKLIGQQILNYYHFAVAILANFVYGFPARNMHVIGVTGTDGKTTTVHMIAAILRANGFKTASFSTIKTDIDGVEVEKGLHTTTPNSFGLQKLFKVAKAAGVTHVVLETTSHALDQHRVWGIPYETAILTNISREHFDYHKDMAKYRRAKKRLFEIASRHPKSTFVLNSDDESFVEFSAIGASRVYSYGSKNKPLVWADKVDATLHGTSFVAHIPFGEIPITLSLPGEYNVSNALAAVGAALAYDVPPEAIAKALSELKVVAGRMEIVESGKGFVVGIDFAVTPNAIEKTLQFARANASGKVIHLFGSAGERDVEKRPILGELSDKNADISIITRDDNRSESVEKVCAQIAKGITSKKLDENYFIIPDRREAIKFALSQAGSGDFVLLSGKGHEKSLNVDGKEIPWDEKQIAEEELEEL